MFKCFQEIIKNYSFRETKRYEVAMIDYPPVVAATGLTLILQLPKAISDISSLRGIPPQSTSKQMINLLKGGNYSTVSYRAGTFTEQRARIIILNVHKHCHIRSLVETTPLARHAIENNTATAITCRPRRKHCAVSPLRDCSLKTS